MAKSSRERWAVALILLAFMGLGLTSSIINPLYEATDELRHYRFVRHIAERGTLPVQGEVGCSVQGHHPPLFYGLGAAVTAWIDTGRELCYAPETNPFWGYRYWEVGVDNKNQYLHGQDEAFPWHGEALAAHIVRAINVLIGAGVVWMTWLIGRTIWPGRPAIALGGMAFVAFNPMFVYMAGAINNDVIAALSGSAVALACLRLLKRDRGLSRQWGVIFGVLYGLALLSKFNLIVLAAIIESALIWVAWRKRQWGVWWQVNLLFVLCAVATAGWWFVRNQVLYGEPTGFQRLTELWGLRDPAESWGLAVSELPYVWTSLWGRFGYGQIPLPEGIYDSLRWLVVVSLLGVPIRFVLRRPEPGEDTGFMLLFLAFDVALFFGVLFAYLLVSPAGPMGRFFFPALPSLAILVFFGLTQWIGLPERVKESSKSRASRAPLLAIMSNVGMASLTAVALFGYLAPAYAGPARFAADVTVPNRVDAQFDALVRLRGYEFDKATILPGESIEVDLYWEVTARPPGNYLLFVHLIDEANTIVAQRDTHPGLGNFPSKLWRPGDRFVESIGVNIPQTAYTPSTVTLSVGLYAPDSYRLGITSAEGTPLGDSLVLGSIEILPAMTERPNPLDQNFNNEIRLIGYEFSQRLLEPGENFTVTLYWESMRATSTDYVVRIRLLDEAGATRIAADNRPQAGRAPTVSWLPGQVIRDSHVIGLDRSLPAAAYMIQVALVDSATNQAQNIVAEDGHWIDNRLSLAKVRVKPNSSKFQSQ